MALFLFGSFFFDQLQCEFRFLVPFQDSDFSLNIHPGSILDHDISTHFHIRIPAKGYIGLFTDREGGFIRDQLEETAAMAATDALFAGILKISGPALGAFIGFHH